MELKEADVHVALANKALVDRQLKKIAKHSGLAFLLVKHTISPQADEIRCDLTEKYAKAAKRHQALEKIEGESGREYVVMLSALSFAAHAMKAYSDSVNEATDAHLAKTKLKQ